MFSRCVILRADESGQYLARVTNTRQTLNCEIDPLCTKGA